MTNKSNKWALLAGVVLLLGSLVGKHYDVPDSGTVVLIGIVAIMMGLFG